MPAVASENSEAGAEAFARWYVETLNYLYQHPKAGVLEKYADDGCKKCHQFEGNVKKYVAEGRRVMGNPFVTKGASVGAGEAGAEHEIVVLVDQEPLGFVDESGERVDQLSEIRGLGLRINMRYAGGWHITSIPLDPTAGDWVEQDQ